MRNIACQHARGAVVCHWDDDDFSAPERVADQVRRLVSSGKSVTGYHSMRFYADNGQVWQYSGAPDYSLGTALMYRRDWWASNPFSNEQIGEDTRFVNRAAVWNEITSVNAGDMMSASIHGGNTSPRNLTGKNWKCLSR